MARIDLQLPGGGPAIRRCIAAALERCGHRVGARPDLRIGIWGYDTDDTPDRRDGAPLVRWWVGTDVEHLAAGRTTPHAADPRFHWAGRAELRDRLRALGVAARVVPVVPTMTPRCAPLPDEPIVLCYCPEGRERLYRWKDTVAVAARLPAVAFRVYRRGGPSSLPNLACVGERPAAAMEAEVLRCRAVLRLVSRDGLSLSVLEALSLGRHAVWSHACLPGCEQAASVAEAARALRQVLRRGVNREGVAAVAELRRAADARMSRYIEEALN